MIIKDAMVIIHLAKITILEKSCEYFKKVLIPRKVYEEIMVGKKKGYGDVEIFLSLVESEKITIKEVKNRKKLDYIHKFNVQEGEAEAVALYWQEGADFIATDDDNIRKKKSLLNIKIIGTPSIILKLYQDKIIKKDKFVSSLNELRKIGWFSNAVIDKILMDVK